GRGVRDLRASGINGPGGEYVALTDDARIPMFESPDQVLVFPTGSGGGRAMIGLTFGKPVTRKIDSNSASSVVSGSSIAQHVGTDKVFWHGGAPAGPQIIPPTAPRSGAMLAAAGRPPDEVLRTKWGFVDATVTVKDLAVNALLAGCRPEYMPLLIAAFGLG